MILRTRLRQIGATRNAIMFGIYTVAFGLAFTLPFPLNFIQGGSSLALCVARAYLLSTVQNDEN